MNKNEELKIRNFKKVEEVDDYLLHDVYNKLDERMYRIVSAELKNSEVWITSIEEETGFEISNSSLWYLNNCLYKGHKFGFTVDA